MLVFRGAAFFPCEKTCNWSVLRRIKFFEKNCPRWKRAIFPNKKSDSPKKGQNNTHPKDVTTPKAGQPLLNHRYESGIPSFFSAKFIKGLVSMGFGFDAFPRSECAGPEF